MTTLFLFLTLVYLIHATPKWHQLHDYDFDQYCLDFGKSYEKQEYKLRKHIFDQRVEQHKIHNADKTKTWKQGVNQFTDLLESEMKGMGGARVSPIHHKSFLDAKHYKHVEDKSFVGVNVDWRLKGVVTPVKDQGRCGSCWSFAAAEALESYFALANGKLIELSEQQILDCTPNPDQCGGTGGCGGATAELAFRQIKEMGGLATEWTYPYNSYFGDNGQCNSSRIKKFAKISGYVNLPTNELQPVLNHLTTVGPLAISVDAGSWSFYEEGIFDGCNQVNPDLDHAVLLVGFGTDPKLGDYWLVRNSWAPLWGESGYIRLRRTSTPRCGIDITPLHGDGCVNGSKTEYVCGTCGVLYDALYPVIQ